MRLLLAVAVSLAVLPASVPERLSHQGEGLDVVVEKHIGPPADVLQCGTGVQAETGDYCVVEVHNPAQWLLHLRLPDGSGMIVMVDREEWIATEIGDRRPTVAIDPDEWVR